MRAAKSSPLPACDQQIVHLVFKTHLDIGFTDLARIVLGDYVKVFIPHALATARTVRESGGDRFVWTTGSWLIHEYLERTRGKVRREFEEAILAGDVSWHALPFTMHSEMLDPSLLRWGIGLSEALDRRFGRKTIAAKMSDVPGHTRGIVPVLARAGIRFLHLGANPASTPPDVPPLFVWRDPPSGEKLIVAYQRSGYGAETLVPGMNAVLAMAHTNDNEGPQTPEAVAEVFKAMRRKFPAAHVVGSTMDAFARLLPAAESRLPVVESEMGDTWIHGIGSDPLKTARFRELSRLRLEWIEKGQLSPDDPAMAAFHRNLLLVAEHTWGLDEKTWLRGHRRFGVLARDRKKPAFRVFESSWVEQRDYLGDAVLALRKKSLHEEAERRLATLLPRRPRGRGRNVAGDRIETPQFSLGIDPATGAMNFLQDKVSGRIGADESHPLGLFRYETFGADDFERFYRQYAINKRTVRHWAVDDFTKPGLKELDNKHRWWQPSVARISRVERSGQSEVRVELSPPRDAVRHFGCPAEIVVVFVISHATPEIAIDLRWFRKPACRLPEAMWISFVPRTLPGGGWLLDKMGAPVSPSEVLRNGNRKLHAVGRGVRYSDPSGALRIDSLDSPLVAPGTPSLLDFNNRLPATRDGMHFNLHNNIWGTNFPMWYEDDGRSRFTLECLWHRRPACE